MHPPLPPLEPRTRRRILLGLWLSIALACVAFRGVLLPFAGAALIAYLVHPLVVRLAALRVAGRRLPHWAGLLVVYAGFFLLAYVFFTALVPQLYRELARVTGRGVALLNSLTPERVQELAQRAEAWMSTRGVPVALSERSLGSGADGTFALELDLQRVLSDAVARVSSSAQENLGRLVSLSRAVVAALAAGVFMLFFMLMVAAFMSIDAGAIRRYFGTLVPPEWAADARVLAHRMDQGLAGVVRGQVTICLVNGVLTLVGLLLFEVKFAFLLATIATLFSLIPIFGTILSSLPIVAIALADGLQKGVAILLWIIGIHALEAYVLNPKIMGSAAHVHPVLVAFALIAGERTYGLVGALFAVPVMALGVALFDHLRERAQPPGAPEVPGPLSGPE